MARPVLLNQPSRLQQDPWTRRPASDRSEAETAKDVRIGLPVNNNLQIRSRTLADWHELDYGAIQLTK